MIFSTIRAAVKHTNGTHSDIHVITTAQEAGTETEYWVRDPDQTEYVFLVAVGGELAAMALHRKLTSYQVLTSASEVAMYATSTSSGMPQTVTSLRAAGYAVIVWSPEELGTAKPSKVEDRSVEDGWDTIAALQGE